MALTGGTRLGAYEILTLIGSGGMGEVYRARDGRLGRDVAIKVLPADVSADPDRVARLEREARILASLNHPNIAHIHGIEDSSGVLALVMELVEGPTLADRIARGPLPLHAALSIATQIAAALEAAHEQGIVHRDLKPANVKVRPDGTVKVLDFGLAKDATPVSPEDSTLLASTQPGVIVGTPAYMSPEQARGEAAGVQADLWSFGVVFCEMLTGRSPFARGTSVETLASVLTGQADLSLLPANTPDGVRRAIRRCLQVDCRQRWRNIGDLRIDIEEASAAPASVASESRPEMTARWRWPRTAAAIALVTLAMAGAWWGGRRSAPQASDAVVRLSFPSAEPLAEQPYGIRHLAISDDGSRVAYASSNHLWIRQLSRRDPVGVDTTGRDPFFSPDGRWVACFVVFEGLIKVPATGGTPVPVARFADRPLGGTWRPDGTIVFATTEGLFRVSENGGDAQLLVKPDPKRQRRAYAWPQTLPGDRRVLFTVLTGDSSTGAQIATLDLATLEIKIVLSGGTAAQYLPTGHLVYASGRTLKAVVFDPATGTTKGESVSLPDVETATATDNGAADFAVSEAGTLAFVAPTQADSVLTTLSWVDRQGHEEPLGLAPGDYRYPRISPDGARVAIDVSSGGNRDIWIWDLQRRTLTRLTDGPTEDLLPVWDRDGSRVFFASDRTGNFDVYSQAADGASAAKPVFSGPGAQFPTSLLPDGTRLLVRENGNRLSLLDLARPGGLEHLLPGNFDVWLATVSPDGRWIAYESNESGNRTDIFVRPFPDTAGHREKVSVDGGRYPLWAPSGAGELFYVDPSGGMMAATIQSTPELRVERVTKLFDWQKPPRTTTGMAYDVSRVDGRFLLDKRAARGADTPVDISIVLNWTSELRAQFRR